MTVAMPVASFSGCFDSRVVRVGIGFCRIRTHYHFRIWLGVVAGRLRVGVITVVGCFLHRMTGVAGFVEVAGDLVKEEAEATFESILPRQASRETAGDQPHRAPQTDAPSVRFFAARRLALNGHLSRSLGGYRLPVAALLSAPNSKCLLSCLHAYWLSEAHLAGNSKFLTH